VQALSALQGVAEVPWRWRQVELQTPEVALKAHL
jgi:hypothetical protein